MSSKGIAIMRTGRFLLAAAALAALPAAAQAAEGESISGFYVGVHGGYSGGSTDWAGTANQIPTPPLVSANTADHATDGFLAGGTIGARYQTGYLVFGIEGEASWADLEDSTPSTAFPGLTNTTEANWIGSVTANVGIHTGRVHGYLEAGLAFTGDRYSVADSNGVAPDQTDRISDTRNGVVLGVGFEYLLDGGWGVRAEYNYMNFGANEYALGGDTWSIDPTRHAVKLGITYRFGG